MHFIKNCKNHFVFCRLMSALSAEKKITMQRIQFRTKQFSQPSRAFSTSTSKFWTECIIRIFCFPNAGTQTAISSAEWGQVPKNKISVANGNVLVIPQNQREIFIYIHQNQRSDQGQNAELKIFDSELLSPISHIKHLSD